MKNLTLIGLLLFSLAQSSVAGLIGTELSLKTIFQATSSSNIETIGFLTTATVIEPGIEFPSLDDLEIDGSGFNLVDVSINIGDDFVEIDFANSAPFSVFASGFENTYVLKFDSASVINIINAKIDNTVTTLGLDSSDVSFVGNELFINVESLAFNSSTFVRINLVATDSISIECAEGQINPVLDIDGNCIVDALTDGLLIIRYMFGLNDNSLIEGATAANCTRCNSDEIIIYLDNLSR